MSAVTVFTLVASTRIINIDVGRVLQAYSQYAIFFLVIPIFIFRYDVAELALLKYQLRFC